MGDTRGEAGRSRWWEPARLARALLFGAAGVGAWTAVLAATLPGEASVRHWANAWVGLDTMEALALAATGLLVLRRDPRVAPVAGATAALFLVDAWFDVTTAPAGLDSTIAWLLAIVFEVPIAVGCGVVGWRAATWSPQPTPIQP
ncbi:MAG TPA: hypothetical protein VF054_16910 [Micromonosporaceae bacterium]